MGVSAFFEKFVEELVLFAEMDDVLVLPFGDLLELGGVEAPVLIGREFVLRKALEEIVDLRDVLERLFLLVFVFVEVLEH